MPLDPHPHSAVYVDLRTINAPFLLVQIREVLLRKPFNLWKGDIPSFGFMIKILDCARKSQCFSCGSRKAKRNYANKEDKENREV